MLDFSVANITAARDFGPRLALTMLGYGKDIWTVRDKVPGMLCEFITDMVLYRSTIALTGPGESGSRRFPVPSLVV